MLRKLERSPSLPTGGWPGRPCTRREIWRRGATYPFFWDMWGCFRFVSGHNLGRTATPGLRPRFSPC